MNRNGRYAFYGSLRKGMQNYCLYEEDLDYLRTIEIRGFKMYALTDYPYIVRTGNADHKIVADLFAVTNPATEQTIYKMELNAGYIFSEIEIAHVKFGIYLFETARADNSEVTGGDWRTYRKLSGF